MHQDGSEFREGPPVDPSGGWKRHLAAAGTFVLWFCIGHVVVLFAVVLMGSAISLVVDSIAARRLESNPLADAWAAPAVCAVGVVAASLAARVRRRHRGAGTGFLGGALATFVSIGVLMLMVPLQTTRLPELARAGLISYGVAALIAAGITGYLWSAFTRSDEARRPN